ncbi:MAG: ParB/RepB/Spo0J family partition protein [Mycolicibacterium sp.]|uniref:ParB/RepB/Spo0J family partition protein n=1 Tax=Mycolicibacterium sp. TaxID=2320850 RepID=UPI003D0B681F
MSTDTAPQTPAGTLEHLDPTTIDIGDNVRDEPENSQGYTEFVASIRAHGVLVPCTAVRHSSGALELREGQRRILAARQAGLTTVPVYITVDTTTTDAARTASRITEQIVTNDRRAGLTEAQRAKGIQQLLGLGVSATKVAKSLSVPKKMVDAAATAAASAAAMAALDTSQLTIEQAAALGEFEHDQEALDYLLAADTAGSFDHRVSEMRQSAGSRAARAQATQALTAQGYTVVTTTPGWSDPLRQGLLSRLYDTEGNQVDENHPAHPSKTPALWTAVLEEIQTYTDTRTGEEIDEYDIDWNVEDDPDAEADDGCVHPRFVVETSTYQPTAFYCHDIAAAGLVTSEDHYAARRSDQQTDDRDEHQRTEGDRREKRKVLALNKLGAAAQEVRRTFVTEKLLSRKTPPKGAAMFVAAQLAANPNLLSSYKVMDTAAELLGQPTTAALTKTTATMPPGSDNRATVVVLGFVLGALESHTDKTAWRTTHSRDYLMFLEANGYELADIEKVITGVHSADVLYDSLTTPTTNEDRHAA